MDVVLLKEVSGGHSDEVLQAIRRVIREQHSTLPVSTIKERLKRTAKTRH